MKKIISLILCACLLISLAACGGNNEVESESKSAEKDSPTETTETADTTDTTSDSADESISESESESESEDDGEEDVGNVKFKSKMYSYLDESVYTYDIENVYNDKYFLRSSYEYSKELAMLSYGAVVANYSEKAMKEFFTNGDFDNILPYSKGYNDVTGPHNVAYTIAHKKVGDYDLIAVSILGFLYTTAWEGNFIVGDSGDHHLGFKLASDRVYDAILDYIGDNYSSSENIKIWLTGFSRGAAIANIVGGLINENAGALGINFEDVFVYTFASPRGVINEKTENKNIFNIISSDDLVPYVMFDSYGFKRNGMDIDVFTKDVGELLSEFNENIVLPKLNGYTSAGVMYEIFISKMTAEVDESKYLSLSTREKYAANYQDGLSKFVRILTSVPLSRLEKIIQSFSGKLVGLIQNIDVQNKLYDELKPELDKYKVAYDDGELKYSCNSAQELLRMLIKNDDRFLNNALKLFGNMNYIKAMHCPETLYVLLKNS